MNIFLVWNVNIPNFFYIFAKIKTQIYETKNYYFNGNNSSKN